MFRTHLIANDAAHILLVQLPQPANAGALIAKQPLIDVTGHTQTAVKNDVGMLLFEICIVLILLILVLAVFVLIIFLVVAMMVTIIRFILFVSQFVVFFIIEFAISLFGFGR